MLKLKRMDPGHYYAKVGQHEIAINRVKSIGFRSVEICWQVLVDGKSLPMCQDTLREAKIDAERHLETLKGN